MKWLSPGLTFVNFTAVGALILGMIGGGLSQSSALTSLSLGTAAAILAYLRTSDSNTGPDTLGSAQLAVKLSKRAQRRLARAGELSSKSPGIRKYRNVWTWVLAACFAVFAVRSFCWLLYIDGADLKIQSPNNLGDLALHITHIRYFANGVPLWPANPIYVFSEHLRYPAGTDLFNAVLCCVNVDLIRGLIWAGLLASVATFYAFYRWGGSFGVAGFLFNGGTAGFEFIKTLKFADYQGDKIAWKSIPLAMFLTQRGLLYAIPAGLLLLWHWREKFFRAALQDQHRAGLPFWVELSLYASMPLFHLHTFLALSVVLVFLFVFGEPLVRGHIATLIGSALIPATFFVWQITEHFHAGSALEWHPGWVQDSADFAAPFFQIGPVNFGADIPLFGWLLQKIWNGIVAPFFQFWLTNFGILVPLVLALIGLCGWRAWKTGIGRNQKQSEDVAFLLPATAIFILAFLVKMAPWGWDNLKIMIWAYFIALPFLWTRLIAHWSMPVRVAVCITLFGSGFVSLFGGLAAGRDGFGFANREELDGVGAAVRELPAKARFAAYPTYNHPLLLQGRKVVLGYPGHLWTQGFKGVGYDNAYNWLTELMQGAENWREAARILRVRYVFWGREEMTNYPKSTRPWEQPAALVASGSWGKVYDLEKTLQPSMAR